MDKKNYKKIIKILNNSIKITKNNINININPIPDKKYFFDSEIIKYVNNNLFLLLYHSRIKVISNDYYYKFYYKNEDGKIIEFLSKRIVFRGNHDDDEFELRIRILNEEDDGEIIFENAAQSKYYKKIFYNIQLNYDILLRHKTDRKRIKDKLKIKEFYDKY